MVTIYASKCEDKKQVIKQAEEKMDGKMDVRHPRRKFRLDTRLAGEAALLAKAIWR
jgi:hypothetical protein